MLYENHVGALASLTRTYLNGFDHQGDSVYLTGSRARGDHATNRAGDPSDIDLLVISHGEYSDANPIYGLASYLRSTPDLAEVEISQSVAKAEYLPRMRSNIAADLRDFRVRLWGSTDDTAHVTYNRTQRDSIEVVAHQAGHLFLSWFGRMAGTPASQRHASQRIDKIVLEMGRFMQPEARTYRNLAADHRVLELALNNRFGSELHAISTHDLAEYAVEFVRSVESRAEAQQIGVSSSFERRYVNLVLRLLGNETFVSLGGSLGSPIVRKLVLESALADIEREAVHTTLAAGRFQPSVGGDYAEVLFNAMTRDYFNLRHARAFGANFGGAV